MAAVRVRQVKEGTLKKTSEKHGNCLCTYCLCARLDTTMAAELIFSSWINIKWISLDYTFIYFLFCLAQFPSCPPTFHARFFLFIAQYFPPILIPTFPQLDLSLFLYSEMLIVSNTERALHIKPAVETKDWINTG